MSRSAKRMMTRFLATLLVMMLAAPAMADIAGPFHRPPRPRPEPIRTAEAPIEIRVDPQADESVLKIPKRLLPTQKLGAIEEQQPVGAGSMRHVFAAIALSCAITGLFFVRRDRKVRAAVVIAVCVCAVAAAGSSMANPPAAPPPPSVEPGPDVAPVPKAIDGKVLIRVTDDGTAVTLVLSGKLAKASGISTATNAAAPAAEAPAPPPPAPSPQ
jgi:hypothetical protein